MESLVPSVLTLRVDGFFKDGIISGYLYRLASSLTVARTAPPQTHSLNNKEERSPDTEKPPPGNALSERDSDENKAAVEHGVVR
jgi:hypothetical protein